jgi:hypothetical protein
MDLVRAVDVVILVGFVVFSLLALLDAFSVGNFFAASQIFFFLVVYRLLSKLLFAYLQKNFPSALEPLEESEE